MPAIAPATLRRFAPYLITCRERYRIGWQGRRKDGPCFVVTRTGALGNDKVIDRFPLTEGGWNMAWAFLVSLNTDAARAVARVLQDRERQARMFATLARGGPVTKFGAIGAQILAGDRAVYTIGSHDSIAETDASRFLGPLAGAKAMIPDLLELGFLGTATERTISAHAAIVLPDGTIYTVGLDGPQAVRQARKQAAQFNAAATAAATENESVARGEPPAMPSVRLMRSPHLLAGHRRHNIGSQDTKKNGPCIVVTRTSALGNDKVIDRFPLTEGGWAMAWAALLDLDPSAAREAARNLRLRLAADAALASWRERQANAYATFARAASVTSAS